MNYTAILHAVATVLVVAGFLASGQGVTVGLIGVGVVLFAAGILVARQGD